MCKRVHVDEYVCMRMKVLERVCVYMYIGVGVCAQHVWMYAHALCVSKWKN